MALTVRLMGMYLRDRFCGYLEGIIKGTNLGPWRWVFRNDSGREPGYLIRNRGSVGASTMLCLGRTVREPRTKKRRW
jgi:hypothetical protein